MLGVFQSQSSVKALIPQSRFQNVRPDAGHSTGEQQFLPRIREEFCRKDPTDSMALELRQRARIYISGAVSIRAVRVSDTQLYSKPARVSSGPLIKKFNKVTHGPPWVTSVKSTSTRRLGKSEHQVV